MKTKLVRVILSLLVGIIFFSGCGGANEAALYKEYEQPQTLQVDLRRLNEGRALLARKVPTFPWIREPLGENASNYFEYGQLDFRHHDISGLNWNDISQEQLNTISFDSETVWPENLPSKFDPAKIMELGKDPGLGIRALHTQGLTGKGINIAIIDQALYQEHNEYKEQLKLYEEYLCSDPIAEMHGSGVSSIAVGKTTGVAPNADLYYIASTAWTDEYDVTPIAEAIYRVIEINNHLPENDKIRVLSISNGYMDDTKGAKEMRQAILDAKKQGIFVICMNTDMHGFEIFGSGGALNSDPNDINARMPALEYREYYWAHPNEYQLGNILIVPQDNRTYASWTGNSMGYEFAANGGISWTAPWLAGFYALCLEAEPNLTIDEFIRICLETGDTIQITHDGETSNWGRIINPQKMISVLTS